MTTKTNRRAFLKQSFLLGTSLAIGISPGASGALLNSAGLVEYELTPFIVIHPDGKIVLISTNPDMGQGSTQAIPTLIAEELEVEVDRITVVQSDGQMKYGSQISGGSGSVVRAWEPLRKAGAAAREMLVKAAAEVWQSSITDCKAENGSVINTVTNKRLNYGELAARAANYEVPQNPRLKSPGEFKLIGKITKRPDVIERVTGKAMFGIDVAVEGMVYAAILHPPSLYSTIQSLDDSKTRSIAGVKDVLKCERVLMQSKAEAVAVIASNTWAALQGKKMLDVTWNLVKDGIDNESYLDDLYAAAKKPGPVHASVGDFDSAYRESASRLETIYESNFLSHAMMEPENVVADVRDDGTAEIWIAYQSPQWAKASVAQYLGIPPEKVKVNIALMGGSFGRKSYADFLFEACFISRQVRKPVKLLWSREESLTQGPYRPGMLSQLQGVMEGDKIIGLHHHAIGETFNAQMHGTLKTGEPDNGLCEEISFKNNKYTLQHTKISHTRVATDIPIMWWRSVWAGNFAWGQECFVDELAHKIKVDPMQVRLDMLQDGRYRNVLKVLGEKSDYNKVLPKNTARGIAMWKSFNSISAACVTVTKDAGKVRIRKVVSVLDCGLFINPDMVKAQMEGCIVMGLSAERISYVNNQCEQTNFHQYQIIRLNEVPDIETYIIADETSPGGVGEPGLPPIAPALGNAIFNLTGKRIRKLPINLDEV
jgi:isoquinoline 1-oxidoreductase beta subunit